MNQTQKDLFTERAATALEGIEMLLAMLIEKSIPGAELWVGESPDRELSRRGWRDSETTASKPAGRTPEPSAMDRRLQHIEERLNRLATDVAALEARVHEEQPE
jgi:hypothetical protein